MPSRDITLTVLVPAFNEAANLRPACETIMRLAPKYFRDCEVLIIDDASKDGTWEIAQLLQRENDRIRSFRNPKNRGLGFNYFFGIEKARCQYVMLIPGDNEASVGSLESIFRQAGSADILVTHIANPRARPLVRQVVSRLFTHTMNFLFGLHLQYYNGINVIRTDLVRDCVPMTTGFAYMALTLVQLLKKGHSYATAGFEVQKRLYGTTKAFRIKNVISVLKSVALLWVRIYCLRACPNKAKPNFR